MFEVKNLSTKSVAVLLSERIMLLADLGGDP